jgi:hypothetical protein
LKPNAFVIAKVLQQLTPMVAQVLQLAGLGARVLNSCEQPDCRQRTPIHPINRVAAFDRNRWPLWIGLGGRIPSESPAALPRIPLLGYGAFDLLSRYQGALWRPAAQILFMLQSAARR